MIYISKYDDLTGQEFGLWTVLYKSNSNHSGIVWHCKCKCGNEKDVQGLSLKRGVSTSCGCNRKNLWMQKIRKYNYYDISGKYGIGFTSNEEKFYFDLDDYNKIKEYCWYLSNYGYVVSHKDNHNTIMLHKLILNDLDNMFNVDHMNHDKFDCRKENLRFVTYSQNNLNKSIQKNNTTGVSGVQWHKRDSVWEVYITIHNKKQYIGRFINFKEAVDCRKSLEQKYYGDYSYDKSLEISTKIIEE